MGAGSSHPIPRKEGSSTRPRHASDGERRVRLRVLRRHLPPGTALPSGVGAVVGAHALRDWAGELPPPPDLPGAGQVPAWFVEDLDQPGTWEPYPAESSDRLERAYREQETTCLVHLRKRTHTVHLGTMQQLPHAPGPAASPSPAMGRTRLVRRALVERCVDPVTGEIRPREVGPSLVDPYATSPRAEEAASPIEPPAAEGGEEGEDVGSEPEPPEEAPSLPQLRRTVVAHTQTIFSLSLSVSPAPCAGETASGAPRGFLALTAGKGGTLLEWNVDSALVVTPYTAGRASSAVLSAVYSPSGRYLLSGSDDYVARLHIAGKRAPRHLLQGHRHKVYGTGFVLGEATAVTGSMDGSVRLWDVETGACTSAETTHASYIFSIALSSQSPHVGISVGDDALVCVHDFRRSSSIVERLAGHTSTLWSCDIRGDDLQVASCGMDRTIRLWDMRMSATALHTLSPHTREIQCVRYLPSGRGILSCGRDGFVFLSHTESGALMWRAKGHRFNIFSLGYHSDRRTMLTCGADATVNIWAWDAEKLF